VAILFVGIETKGKVLETIAETDDPAASALAASAAR
jgi:hypothetical protein